MKNIIKNHLTQADRDQFDSLLSQMETLLSGKLTALSEAERREFGSVNEKNKLLINKVLDYRRHSPGLSSPDVDWTEFEADYESRVFHETRINRLLSLVYQMESAKILHDYDNHSDSRRDYGYSKYKNKVGESGYSEKVAQLRQFFNRTGTGTKNKRKNNDETPSI